MPDNEEPLLTEDASLTDPIPFLKLKRWQWWVLVCLNTVFDVVGEATVILLIRFYFDKGGKSTWMITFLQTAGFPILLIPYIYIGCASQTPSNTQPNPPSLLAVCLIYFVLGAMAAGYNKLYAVGLSYLSASTYALVCASLLAFTAVFTFLINHQKFTVLILNSVVVLTLSASLLAINGNSSEPSGVSMGEYVIGFVSTLGASLLAALYLSLTQLSFQKVLKKQTFSVVLELQISSALVATCISTIGLFASGEWRTLHDEMNAFSTGRLSYVMTLLWTAVVWQIVAVAVLSLIFLVSSLFSNVITTLSLAITPIAAVIVFHDQMNGVKIIAMLMALWSFACYFYQNYIDDMRARNTEANTEGTPSDSLCGYQL